jgi:hypothetical protein
MVRRGLGVASLWTVRRATQERCVREHSRLCLPGREARARTRASSSRQSLAGQRRASQAR